MRILVTGAAGMLGSDVCRAATAAGHELLARSRDQLDVCDRDAVMRALKGTRPDAVINCAAYTNVDAAESEPDAAAAANATGPANLAAATAATGAWLMHVSTDYVFDGTKTTPYLESDATGPRSVYGSTKLLGERAVTLAAPQSHTIVRTSWLFGAGGRCFPDTMLALAAQRDTLSVVADQVGCPTFTADLAAALVGLAAGPKRPGVLHVAASGECSWYQFAVEIMRASDTDTQVLPCTTEQFPRPARRPAYSVLRSERGAPVLAHWRDGLARYLHVRLQSPAP
jgi:dTDP-4-dehydrorhamnose reductase